MVTDKLLKKYDSWLQETGPSALVIREYLMPIEGRDGVVFPATFAASEDKTFKGGYNIDEFPDGKNVCLIDSVGSQANRIEPMFAKKEYPDFVPQIVVRAGEKQVNLLEAGHRAGDAIVRCSELQQKLQEAFKAVLNGDAEPLAKIAPTSMVFGVWDSRDTQAKLPRLIASTIRAFDVRKLTRSATYSPPVDYAELKVFSEEDKARAEGDSKNPLAKRGFVHHPASGSHGGVIALSGIRRDGSLHLAALRLLAGKDETKTIALRRYILGLALIAFTAPPACYLRQGCNLVLDSDKPRELKLVFSDGQRKDVTLTHQEALEYAKAAAKAFGIGQARTVTFDSKLAKNDVARKDGQETKKARAKKTT